MSGTTCYQKSREVILNRANEYYENNKVVLREKERETDRDRDRDRDRETEQKISEEEKKCKERIWKEQIA